MRSKVISVLAGAAIAAASVGLLASTASAAGGTVTVTPGSGASNTSFTVYPPSPSFCPGDAATNGYRLNSFVVPLSVDPGTLTYDSNGPVTTGTDNKYPLYLTTTAAYTNTTDLGIGDGLILNPPPFNWTVFVGTLPAGDYHIGLACTLGGVTKSYFSADITLTSDLHYSPYLAPQVPEVPLNVLLPLSAAVILGGGFLVARKRHNATTV